MPEEKILDKIRALLAKTEASGCTPEEAESAFALAQRLMAKHAVNEETLISAGRQTAREPIIKHRVHLRSRDEVKRQRLAVISVIAKANNCRAVDATDGHDEVWIVGHESEAFFVEILSAAVLMQFATERTRGWKEFRDLNPYTSVSRFKWLQSFAWGYAGRICERILGEAEEAVTGKELVFVGRQTLVQEWMEQNLQTQSRKARPITVYSSIADQGADAANRADLSGGRNHVRGAGAKALGR